MKTMHLGHCKILPYFWIFPNPSRVGRRREGRCSLERMSYDEMDTFLNGLQTPGAHGSICLC